VHDLPRREEEHSVLTGAVHLVEKPHSATHNETLGIGLAGTRLSPLIDGRWIGLTRDRSVGSFDP
jgi:hypothetical protein